METFSALGRFVLFLVFTVAGLAKLADRAGAKKSMSDFGVAAALAGPLALGLPISELTVAAALVFGGFAKWGAVGALCLLLVFIVGISVSLARGRRPDCHWLWPATLLASRVEGSDTECGALRACCFCSLAGIGENRAGSLGRSYGVLCPPANQDYSCCASSPARWSLMSGSL
jgi:Methylamine utilisation protein MauE